MGIHNQVDRAGVVILEQDLFPRFSAIDATKNAALGIRAIGVAQSRYKDNVRVARMNHDASDMLSVFQTDVGPGLAPVGTLVHTVPVGDVAANACFSRAYVHHVGVGIGHRDRSD